MARGVQQHPYVMLRLVCRLGGPERDGCADRLIEVVYLDIEVKLHLLATRLIGPGRWHVTLRGLDREVAHPLAGVEGDETGILGIEHPSEDSCIELAESLRVRGVKWSR